MPEDLPWHTDAEGGRLADLIIDLSSPKHEGGLFQMRDAHTQAIFNEVGDLDFDAADEESVGDWRVGRSEASRMRRAPEVVAEATDEFVRQRVAA